MAVEVSSGRTLIVEMADGEPRYVRESYYIKGLTRSPVMTPQEVIAAGVAAAPTVLPDLDAPRDGLPQTSYRVHQMPSSGTSRRAVVTWGRRANSGAPLPTTRMQRIRNHRGRIVQPYVTVSAPGGGQQGPPYIQIKQREIRRVVQRVYLGRLVDSVFTQQQIADIAALNDGYLYAVNGQAALLAGVEFSDLPSNQLWVWTIFERSSWVRAFGPNAIEQDSLTVAGLSPLAEYGIVNTTTGTPAIAPENLYDAGGGLPWLN